MFESLSCNSSFRISSETKQNKHDLLSYVMMEFLIPNTITGAISNDKCYCLHLK